MIFDTTIMNFFVVGNLQHSRCCLFEFAIRFVLQANVDVLDLQCSNLGALT